MLAGLKQDDRGCRKQLQQTQMKLTEAEAALKTSNPFAPTDLRAADGLQPQVLSQQCII